MTDPPFRSARQLAALEFARFLEREFQGFVPPEGYA